MDQSQPQGGAATPTAVPQKGGALKWLLVILVIVILVGGGYYYYINYYQKTTPTTTTSPTATPVAKSSKSPSPGINATPIKTSTPSGNNTSTKPTSAGWKTAIGCVQPLDTSIQLNFQIDIPDNYNPVGPDDYGCGKRTYWNLGYISTDAMGSIGIETTTIQTLLPNERPDEVTWFQASAPNNQYFIAIKRTKPETRGGVSFTGISDEQWAYMKQSFSFK